jgi:hypothetical protein
MNNCSKHLCAGDQPLYYLPILHIILIIQAGMKCQHGKCQSISPFFNLFFFLPFFWCCLATSVRSSPRLKAARKKQTASRAISNRTYAAARASSKDVVDDSVKGDHSSEKSNYSDDDSIGVNASEAR